MADTTKVFGFRPVTSECIEGGQVVGNVLQLQCPSGVVNIPLDGVGGVDFDNLAPLQIDALRSALRGNEATDVFKNYIGHFI